MSCCDKSEPQGFVHKNQEWIFSKAGLYFWDDKAVRDFYEDTIENSDRQPLFRGSAISRKREASF